MCLNSKVNDACVACCLPPVVQQLPPPPANPSPALSPTTPEITIDWWCRSAVVCTSALQSFPTNLLLSEEFRPNKKDEAISRPCRSLCLFITLAEILPLWSGTESFTAADDASQAADGVLKRSSSSKTDPWVSIKVFHKIQKAKKNSIVVSVWVMQSLEIWQELGLICFVNGCLLPRMVVLYL